MTQREPIVVIGSACRLPGATNTPSKLWSLLRQPRDLGSEVPKDRFNIDAFYHPDGPRKGRTNARHGYFLDEDLHAFDAPFFRIQAGEAESMDPQQRLLLETTYDAVAAAGLGMDDLRGSDTAVYVGIMSHDFEVTKTRDLEHCQTYLATGAATSIASNRLSYFFDWHGPSMTLDTACSSSLVAVHQAVQQLRSGGSKVAVAAGANIILSPMAYITESQLKMLSPTGKSRMWDENADGYARGEGVCSVVLKTLSQALADGDTIECVIRETGVNQDGRTTGITMPNGHAQAALIRETYERAGLDTRKAEDRCQFFEAHGTGTPAGDPQEAEAIASAFFGHGSSNPTGSTIDGDKVIFVGSIKTILGHTEGTAGIAGLMKASLAVQHGVMPPNMLFNNLSPKVAPFYQNLRILQEATPWPQLKAGQPRRVSVNSFGFGGTNAHAIIEEYRTSETPKSDIVPTAPASTSNSANALPLVLSASSDRSLKRQMEDLLRFLQQNPDTNLLDLTWTLLSKRSVLPVRQVILGHSKDAICDALDKAITEPSAEASSSTPKSSTAHARILGVFTGQGAQWPGMGRELLVSIPYAKQIVDELDHALQTLPAEYRPSWTIHDQLMLQGASSNVKDAEYSQPLCCAVQIVLVRLLAAAGIRFTTIVGHSSGEIAAAYACGFLSAAQAVKVAYLRGLTSKHAASPSGGGSSSGAMMAAGLSLESARELVELEAFHGRVCVAASNSAESTTFSGDADAIDELAAVLEDESTFARVLKVDKAYHSHHMLACAEPYIKALVDCGCAAADGPGSSDVVWYSSVHENKRMAASDVTAEYWKDNLVSPVTFMQAVENAAIEQGPLSAAVEVGCHPVLKAPALTTIKTIVPEGLPYTGCMQRGGNDVDSFAGGLGYLWECFGRGIIDPSTFASTVFPSKEAPQSLAKIVPSYPWDHTRSYWLETRAITNDLHAPASHLLLGKPSSSNSASTLQWHNVIRPKDHEWLQGHALQGQAVFPAAGYVMAAMEAALTVAGDRPVELIEVLDMSIDKAVTFVDEDSSAELIVNLQVTANTAHRIDLSFTVDSCIGKESKPSTSAKAQVVVTIAQAPPPAPPHVLPRAQDGFPHLANVSVKRFYEELDDLGYAYSNDFRQLQAISRADARASGTMPHPALRDAFAHRLVLHPATLDLAFQTLMGAYAAPGDKRLRSIYVPTRVDRIALVPGTCASAALVSRAAEGEAPQVSFQTTITYDKGDYIAGDIEVFDEQNDREVLFQVEGMHLKPLSPPSAAEDHRLFTKTVWGPLTPDKVLDNPELYPTQQDREAIPIIERICYFFMRALLSQITDEDRAKATKPHQRYIYWNEHVSARVRAGTWHEWYDAAWEQDTAEFIDKLGKEHWYHPHVRIAFRVHENALETIRTQGNPFLWFDHDGLLTEFYTSPLTDSSGWHYGAQLVSQLAHRHQAMNILEIGAGTGSGTSYVLSAPQLNINSYTFTDISPAFFARAKTHFADFEDRMVFRKLDISAPVAEQGFTPHSYDMVVAWSVLHATPKLAETMANVRSLLKPGGHVVMLEATHKAHTRVGYLFGLFADWWAGLDEGRDLDPFATLDEWDAIFRKTGFSGVESQSTDRNSHLFMNTLFSTRATNSKVARLYEPLSAPPDADAPPLVVIGGESSESLRVLNQMRLALPHRQIRVVPRLRDLHQATFDAKCSFVLLSELDEETFADVDEVKLESLKAMFAHASHVLWLTENAWVDHPFQAMSIAFLRSVRLENPTTLMQSLDVDEVQKMDASILVEHLLRLEEGSGVTDDTLWTFEPEIYVCNGRACIPRVRHDIQRDSRLASERRPITALVHPNETPVGLKVRTGAAYLESAELLSQRNDKTDSDEVTIESHYSLAKAVRVGDLGYLNIIQGTVAGTGKAVVALSATNASSIRVPRSHVVDISLSADSTAASSSACLQVAARLLAERMVSSTTQGSSLLVFEPTSVLGKALALEAARQKVHVHLATTASGCDIPSSPLVSCVKLHPRETDIGLRRALPANVAAFYNLSPGRNDTLASRLSALLPRGCLQFGLESLVQDVAAPARPADDEYAAAAFAGFQQRIAEAVKISEEALAVEVTDITALSETAELKEANALSTWSTIKWSRDSAVSARVLPIDAGKLFSANKTYLLLGLAGSLGRSLARWMITHGARHVVISSRNPEPADPKWLADISRLGGLITVLSVDVSSAASIDAGLAHIKAHLPPVGGIAYGPLVLHDVLLRNMDLAMWNVPIKSKVVGAQLLHERFGDNKTAPLEFFVMFSSVAGVGGNPGQSNYTAANAFLQALANQRHAKGLPSSTIHIGAIIGVGYLARTQREQELTLWSDTVSEDEFLKLFAEAIVSGKRPAKTGASRVAQTAELEVITGVPELSSRNKETVKFAHDPRFGNMKIPEGQAESGGAGDSKGSIKDRLLNATSMDEVTQIIVDGLSEKMRGTLHIPAEEQVSTTAPLIDQGVDSLGAITVGTWFSKTLLVDIPLLRVLGGASIAELSAEAAERLLPSAIPLVKGGGAHASNPAPADDQQNSSSSSSVVSPGATPSSEQSEFLATPATEMPPSLEDAHSSANKAVPLSLTQEHAWKLQRLFPDNPAIFNNTIGMFMQGQVDLERLAKAFTTTMTRHDIFRTAFRGQGPDNAQPVQVLLEAPVSALKCVQVADRAAAEAGFEAVAAETYRIAEGETLKLVDFFWGQGADQHLFVFGYHRLAGDGSTTENLLAEVDQLYKGVALPAPAAQYAAFAHRQRRALETGALDADIRYWTDMHTTRGPLLPILPLPQAQPQRAACDWGEHTALVRLSSVLAFRVRERAKRCTGATPMHFYLAAFHQLLARLTGGVAADVAVGIADTNRASVQDTATMGYFANLLPVRFVAGGDGELTFATALAATRDAVRGALKHSQVPYGVTLERLGLAGSSELKQAPLFQTVFDYRQGAAETGSLGGASFSEIKASRERTPFDVVLEMSDDPAKDPLVTVKLQSSLYGEGDAHVFAHAYVELLTKFAANVGLKVADVDLALKC